MSSAEIYPEFLVLIFTLDDASANVGQFTDAFGVCLHNVFWYQADNIPMFM